jgi:hypothetical protein
MHIRRYILQTEYFSIRCIWHHTVNSRVYTRQSIHSTWPVYLVDPSQSEAGQTHGKGQFLGWVMFLPILFLRRSIAPSPVGLGLTGVCRFCADFGLSVSSLRLVSPSLWCETGNLVLYTSRLPSRPVVYVSHWLKHDLYIGPLNDQGLKPPFQSCFGVSTGHFLHIETWPELPISQVMDWLIIWVWKYPKST